MIRICEHPDCDVELESDWPYAWCEYCCATAKCHHGKRPEDCNDCMVESDQLFDAGREQRLFGGEK